MTNTAKQIIEIAWDKKQTIWCIVERSKTFFRKWLGRCNSWEPWVLIKPWICKYKKTWMSEWKYKIIWHPIHFWHIMKLNKESQNSLARWLFDKILNRFNNNLHLYSQDCLSWDEEINQLILNYLLTVKWN